MANSETKIGQLVIDLKIKTEALEKGLETAKKQLQEIENENNNLKNSNSTIDASFVALAGSITASLMGIQSVIKSSVEEYKAYEQSMSSLQNVADYTGNSMNDLTKITKKYESVMNKSDIATTVKNFTLMGMSVEETDDMIQALTNSAIRNRNANYTVSEAVRVASEGYRQGLSTLSDSAGVTENLSVMLDKYAQSIGKTASQLTEQEKNQAYVNRTMAAAEPFAGAMEGYLDSLAGKQGEYSQALRETQVAYAEAMEPILIQFEEFKTNMVSGLGDIISEHKSATAGVTSFVATLGTLSIAIIAVKKAYDMYKNTIIATKIAQEGLNVAMKANPVGIAVTGITLAVSALSAYTAATKSQKDAEADLLEIQKQHYEVMKGTIELNEKNINSVTSVRDELQSYIDAVQQLKLNDIQINSLNTEEKMGLIDSEEYKTELNAIKAENEVLTKEIDDMTKKFQEMFNIPDEALECIATFNNSISETETIFGQTIKKNTLFGISLNKIGDYVDVYNKRIDTAAKKGKIKEAMDTETIKTQQKEAAQLKANANQMQIYLNTIKKGDKSTSNYKNAVQKLAKAYPEAASASGIIVDKAQDFINAEKGKADAAWNTSQDTIKSSISIVQSYIDQANAAKNSITQQNSLADELGISYSKIIPTLTSVLNILQMIGGYKPEEVPNVTPTTPTYTPKTTSSKASKSYSNKKLDNYKAEIEYKKSLDKLSLQQEIAMYKKALKSYAKTTEEKRDLRVKIYELNKELAQKEKEMLDQQTEDYENYIQDQINSRGSAYDIKEQTKDYDKIISMHKKYLKQIMKDERLSLDERKEIYREELQTVREYEQQKRDLRVEAVDNTVSQLTDALTKQLEEMQEKDKEAIDKNIEEVEKWKDARIEAINEEYDARIEAIEKELEALDKAEEEKTRAEEDAEYERKKNRLEELIAFEHDATTRANYQKELNKLVEDYQKTLDKRALDDKKDALEEQKDLLQEEQDSRIDEIEKEAEAQKEAYEKQLDELEKYYEEQIDMAQDTAEKMLLNVQKNQDQILELLKKYGNAYEITGQSLGEKLAQGLESGMAGKIESFIQKMQDKIDSSIESKIKEWTSSNYKYNSSEGKPQTNTINITQQNYIQQMPETPSETYRKLNAVSEKLAEELSG